MGDGVVKVQSVSTGDKNIDNTELAVGANIVERQRVQLGGAGAAELGDIRNATPGGTDYGLVTRNIPSGTQGISSAAASQVDGHSATIGTTTDTSAANTLVGLLKKLISLLPAAFGAGGGVKIDGSGTALPVSGAVTANIGSSGSLALDATLTGGTAKAIARGGIKGATTAADVTGTAEGADHQALDVQIYHGGTAKDPTLIRALTSADVVTTAPPANASENIAQFGGSAVTLGQKAAASSIPVVLPNDANGASQASAVFVQPRQLVTYTAVYRLAARPYALSSAFGAAGRKQYATIHHAVGATKTVKLKRVEVALESGSVAGIVVADLIRITTAPATGNPAITPSAQNPGDAAAEATCLALPTTAATEAGLQAMQEWNLGITTTGSTINPPPGLNWYTLWPQTQGAPEASEDKYPTMRPATLEGYAVTLDASVAETVKGYVVIEFTEE